MKTATNDTGLAPVLSHNESEQVRRKFAATAQHNGQALTLVGGWQDMAGYYSNGTELFAFQSMAGYGSSSRGSFVFVSELSDAPAKLRRYRGGLFPPMLTIFTEDGGWMVQSSCPVSAHLFGTDTLPTPFLLPIPAEQVINVLLKSFPGSTVTVRK